MSLRSDQLAKPRASPADVQAVVDLWKMKHPAVAKDKTEFRVWATKTLNHWSPPYGPLVPESWSEEDVVKCREALEAIT